MAILKSLLLVIVVLSSLLLVIIILLQKSKSEGLGLAFDQVLENHFWCKSRMYIEAMSHCYNFPISCFASV